jgi:hypothetical protein
VGRKDKSKPWRSKMKNRGSYQKLLNAFSALSLNRGKRGNAISIYRKNNKCQWRYNQALCYYLKVEPSISNMESFGMVLPENVIKLKRG